MPEQLDDRLALVSVVLFDAPRESEVICAESCRLRGLWDQVGGILLRRSSEAGTMESRRLLGLLSEHPDACTSFFALVAVLVSPPTLHRDRIQVSY